MKCTHCGAEITDGVAQCPVCGKPTASAQPTPPAYGNPQQPAYGAQPPAYGYPQQPVYGAYPPPQPVYVTPVPQVAAASPAEKDALFSTVGSIWMLIAAIVVTINVITGFISNVISLSILNILLVVCDILIAVGFWVSFVNGKKKKMSSAGLSLIRVPYIINFVFLVLGFVVNFLVWIFTLSILSLVFGILSFIFECICFSSVKKTLNMGTDIARNHSVAGRKAGVFAAVVMIISASLTLIQEIINYLTMAAIAELLEDTPIAFIGAIISAGGVMTVVAAVVAFLAGISTAIVLLMFAKKIKQANG